MARTFSSGLPPKIFSNPQIFFDGLSVSSYNVVPASVLDYGNGYTSGIAQSVTVSPPAPYLSLVSGGEPVDSDVKCGKDNRNFCNYPSLPFIETLNIPQLLAAPNRLNRLSSGRCPIGYKKYPTKDCINVAAAFIEVTCCVYVSFRL